VRVRGVRKTYRLGRVDVPVLHGVDLDLRPGEWVAILGASGSGKSTLLHLLGGLDRPDKARNGRDRARIEFEGRDLASLSPRELDRYRAQSVGFVFQFYHLLPELNVLDNVLLGRMIRHGRLGYIRARGPARARAGEILGAFGLGERLRHRPAELSGGERQRVAIARALMNDPLLLLADEPTGNLDRKTGSAILDVLAAIRAERGQTMLMVTHDPEIASRADRVVHLVDGRVVQGHGFNPVPSGVGGA
jgi:lipoprotein-releasing system ATP-binding protein